MNTTDRPDSPGVRFPPPFIYVVVFALGMVLNRFYPLPIAAADAAWRPIVGGVLIVAGFATVMAAMAAFRAHNTAILPHKAARTIVDRGPFRFSRNPMYTAIAVMYIGGALLLNSWMPVFLLPVAMWQIFMLVIRREEAYLTRAFGTQYQEYQRRVRRWI